MTERLDQQLLRELETIMDDKFGLLLEAYLEDSAQRYFEVAQAWEEGDLVRLQHSAHSLKGASSNIGAVALASLCGELELLARTQAQARLAVVLPRFKAELTEVRQEVEALRIHF
jgi:HPt (histidine-containing phosphotransfer) domain-containing protein